MKRFFKRLSLALLIMFLGIQLIPYGREHSNPPITKEPAWDTPQTRELAKAACFDCHSNETRWPWYSYVAPVSWLVARDVEEGREHLNFSEWDRPQHDAEEAAEELLEGEMPLWFYPLLHPAARLDETQKQTLATGLSKSLVGVAGSTGSTGHHDDDDDD